MDEYDVRELKMMVGGAALMSTGATLYTIPGPAPSWIAISGFFGLLADIVLLGLGASGY